jgi:hypothetical protein
LKIATTINWEKATIKPLAFFAKWLKKYFNN